MPDSLSRQHDLSRSEIISRFNQRIERGKRSKLTREERDSLALLLRDSLIEWAHEGTDTRERIEQRCTEEVRLLERGYSQSTLNSDYLPVYTRLVKEAIASGDLPLTAQNSYDKEWTKWDGSDSGVSRRHYALDFLTYDLATQKQLRAKSTRRNNERQDEMQPIEVEVYLDKLDWLLESDRLELLAIAIAGATGRRHTEVVSLGVFESTDHPYLLRFSGQQKKSEDVGAFDILTLLPADKVLDALQRLRARSEVRDLVGARHDDARIGKLNARINYWCDRELGSLVPIPPGFKSVTIHRLRGVYGAIAIYLFCPPQQHLHRFVQRYLGHILDLDDEDAARPNSRASDYYFHFYPSRDGQPLSERGVRLAEVPPLTDNEDISRSLEPDASMPQSRPTCIEIEIYPDDYDRLQLAVPGQSSSAEAVHALLDRLSDKLTVEAEGEGFGLVARLVDSLECQLERQSDIIACQAETISRQAEAAAIEGSNFRVEQLAAQSSGQSSGDDGQLRALQQQVEALRAERDDLYAQLHDARTKLDRIQSLFPGTTSQSSALTSELKGSQDLRSSDGDDDGGSCSSDYRNKYRIEERCRLTLDGIIDWNLKHSENQRFAISPGFLRRVFKIYKDAAEEFCAAQADEIEAHHRNIGVSPERIRYFNRGKPYEALRHFVEQNYY